MPVYTYFFLLLLEQAESEGALRGGVSIHTDKRQEAHVNTNKQHGSEHCALLRILCLHSGHESRMCELIYSRRIKSKIKCKIKKLSVVSLTGSVH